jgi:hypothetical protein
LWIADATELVAFIPLLMIAYGGGTSVRDGRTCQRCC